jgi:carbon monoxide dehydrogenase subunit G
LKLEHSFTVPADLDTVWQAVLDPERVAPCMPGATLTEVDGDAFKGSVKVKMGPISLLYKGTGEFLSKDADTGTVVIKAAGKDARGNGTASATVTVTLTGAGASTVGSVSTDLSVTGKPAQFGRGLISEVGGKILDSFATCLASKLAPAADEPPKLSLVEEPASAESAVSTAAEETVAPATTKDTAQHTEARETGRQAGEATAAHASSAAKPRLAAAPEPEPEPIDLLAYAGPSVLKRVAPLMALVAAVLAFIALRRRH